MIVAHPSTPSRTTTPNSLSPYATKQMMKTLLSDSEPLESTSASSTPPLTPLSPDSTVNSHLSPLPNYAVKIPKPPQFNGRSQSEPNLHSNGQRRSIFGHVWRQCPDPAASTSDTPRRAASISESPTAVTTNSTNNENEASLRRIARPPADRLVDNPHFVALDQVPKAATGSLPELPYPLRRFYGNGSRTQLHGVYPMVSPSPILRESSYGSSCPVKNNETFSSEDDSSSARSSSSSLMPSFNLVTDSVRITATRKVWNGETPDTSSASVSNDSQQKRHTTKVHFDPRVTVTEFEDPTPRWWFSESELERLKWESIHIVRKYLIANPAMIDEYNVPHLDPITNTYRKKALFSIPVLSANSEEELLEQSRARAEVTANDQVKNILIAARNRLVLDLLSRSLKMIFPRANIDTATTGEEAIVVFRENAWRGQAFDLVLADGRLDQSLHGRGNSLDRIQLGWDRNFMLPMKTGSLGDLNVAKSRPAVCGVELFRRIAKMTDGSGTSTKSTEFDEDAPASVSPFHRVPLLVGLTTNPETEGMFMKESGATLVWGLPPPRMDELLRDEIVSSLMQKRHAVLASNIL